MMKKLFVFLIVVVAAAGVVVELVAPLLVARRIEDETAARTREVTKVAADIDSFPFVTRLATTGRIANLAVSLEEVAEQQLTWTRIRFDFNGIELDRAALLRGDIEVRSIESGTITAELSDDAISEVAGAALDSLGVPEVSGDSLVLGDATVPLPAVIACSPTAEVADGRLVLSCPLERMPPFILDSVEASY